MLTAEVTVEVNPTLSKNGVSLEELQEIGFSRISLGLQSLDDVALKHMLREHTAKGGLEALERTARVFRPERVTVDVMVGLPPLWRDRFDLHKDLEKISQFADHISVYELTVEAGTKLAKSVERSETALACPERSADEWQMVVETLANLGYERYEVSNFARNGRRSRHNEAVWHGNCYAGVGPGKKTHTHTHAHRI